LDSRLPPAGTRPKTARRLESKGNAFGQAAAGGREKALPFHSRPKGRTFTVTYMAPCVAPVTLKIRYANFHGKTEIEMGSRLGSG